MAYVYVLASRENSLFLQMVLISATLLRKHSSNAEILIVIDEHTSLEKHAFEYKLLMKLNVKVIVFATGQSDAVFSSRFIKLSLPDIVNERFCYLDCDTLPMQNIDDLCISSDIAMVRDLNKPEAEFILNPGRVTNCREMNWPIPRYPYFNSGVIYAKNSLEVKGLFRYAKTLWLEACEKGVGCGDQLPLNIALKAISEISVSILDDSYNAQIRSIPSLAVNAKILHIFSGSINKHNDTVLHLLIDNLRNGRGLRTDILDNLLMTRNPWIKSSRQGRLFPFRKILSRLSI